MGQADRRSQHNKLNDTDDDDDDNTDIIMTKMITRKPKQWYRPADPCWQCM